MAWKASDRREVGEPVKRVVRGSKEEQRGAASAEGGAGCGWRRRRGEKKGR